MTLLALLMATGVCVLAGLAYWRRRPTTRKVPAMIGFARAMALDSGFTKDISNRLAERSRLIAEVEAAPPPTDSEIPEIITWFYRADELLQVLAEIRLKKAGPRAIPLLRAALSDPRCSWKKPSNGPSRVSSPAAAVSLILWDLRDRSLGSRIEHLTDDSEWATFYIACRAKAALGSVEVLPWVLAILRSSNEYATRRSEYVTAGVDRAIEEGWADPQFMAGLRNWAKTNIDDDKQPVLRWAVQFVARHEPDAIELLTAPPILCPENNRNLSIVISELNRLGALVQQDVLLPIIDKSRTATDSRWQLVLGPALWALAASNRSLAMQIAEQGLSAGDVIFDQSLTFLRRINGLPKAWQLDPPKGMTLTRDEQAVAEHLSNISNLTGEIKNGGIEQYFFNSTGNDWRTHLTSLLAVGLPKSAAALEASAFLIHPDGAATNREQRIKQFAALSDDDLARLRKAALPILGREFEVGQLRYMHAHADLLMRIRDERIRAGIDEPEPPFM